MNRFKESPVTSNLQASLSQLEATINSNKPNRANEASETDNTKEQTNNDESKAQAIVTPNKWPLKPGVLVHVNSNHTLSPKNQARLHNTNANKSTEKPENNLGILERNQEARGSNKTPPKMEYSRKEGKPKKRSQSVVSGIIRNIRKISNEYSDDESGKYKKINKSNKRAISLMSLGKTGSGLPKRTIRSFFQSETPNVIVTEGGSSTILIIKYT